MIKICYVIGTLDVGGAERQLLLLAKNLDRSLFWVSVISLRGGRMKEEFEDAGISLKIIDKKWKIDPLFFARLVSAIKEEKPDIIHTFMFTSNTWGRAAGLIARVPAMVASERSMDLWKKPHHFLIDGFFAHFTKKIICNSGEVKQRYLKNLRVSPEKLMVIHNGLDIKKYENIRETETIKESIGIKNQKVVLTGGRLSWEKGLEYLLHAAKKVLEKVSETIFVIAGEGPERNNLEKTAHSLNISGNVIFAGYRDDLPCLLKICDIAVLSSLWEGMPNFLLEAMAMKKPVVSTNAGGSKEIVTDGINGFLVEPRDVESLAERIVHLLEKPELCRIMGEKGYEKVIAGFSTDKMVRKYTALYREIAQDKNQLTDKNES